MVKCFKILGFSFLLLGLFIPASQVFAKEFKQALPGYTFQFPKDHRAHTEYKTEWWYYTGHLKSKDGNEYGYELTFFRTALKPDSEVKTDNSKSQWRLNQIYPAHFAITDIKNKAFYYTELLTRKGIGFADANTLTHDIKNTNWKSELVTLKGGYGFHINASHPDFSIDLNLTPDKKPVVHGHNGISKKAACTGCASHYYSIPRLTTTGSLRIKNKTQPVKGTTWMDQEFGSNQLAESQTGWDWFSIQLDNQQEIMLYLLRNADGSIDSNSSGTVIYPNGKQKHLTIKDFKVTTLNQKWTSKKTGGQYPQAWQIDVPSEKISLTLSSDLPNQEMTTQLSTGTAYWEGSVSIKGKQNNTPVLGKGYVEMTGYAEKFKQKI